jgi:hypothetical protein
VVSARVEVHEGVFTVVTTTEFIVVSDVIASPFAISHTIPKYFYKLRHQLEKWSASLLRLLVGM